MLYLPFWLASAVSGYSAHRFHLGKIHFEHLLLLGGILTLVLSVSRIGLLTFLLMFAFLLLLWNIRLVRWLQHRAIRGAQADERRMWAARRWTAVVSVLVLLALYAGLTFGAAYGISRYDDRMKRLFDFSALQEGSLLHYANQLVFAERLVFWQAGWEVFNDHPVTGVGLGNAGYFFPQKLSSFSWALTEVRTLMYRQSNLPNTKSLWVRLLAETGIIGFAFFACWCYILWQSAQFLRAQREPLFRMIGLGGSFALIGFLIEGFSLDSFALPYYWVTFGLLTAACELVRCSLVKHQGGSRGIAEG
jgi:O-antigen ligase